MKNTSDGGMRFVLGIHLSKLLYNTLFCSMASGPCTILTGKRCELADLSGTLIQSTGKPTDDLSRCRASRIRYLAAVNAERSSPGRRAKWTRAGILQPEVGRPETELECEKKLSLGLIKRALWIYMKHAIEAETPLPTDWTCHNSQKPCGSVRNPQRASDRVKRVLVHSASEPSCSSGR